MRLKIRISLHKATYLRLMFPICRERPPLTGPLLPVLFHLGLEGPGESRGGVAKAGRGAGVGGAIARAAVTSTLVLSDRLVSLGVSCCSEGSVFWAGGRLR